MKRGNMRNNSSWFKKIPMPVLFTAAVLIIISAYVLSVTGEYITRSLSGIKVLQR